VKSSRETPSESDQLSAASDLLRDILENGTAGTGKSRFRCALREPAAVGSETLRVGTHRANKNFLPETSRLPLPDRSDSFASSTARTLQKIEKIALVSSQDPWSH
jgi:hypothetical protein